MSEVTANKVWPSDIPLPYIDYGGIPRNTTRTSHLQFGATQRRSRYSRSYHTLSVRWVLTHAQRQSFKEFFDDTIHNGAASFKIELKFPKLSTLKEWLVKFTSDPVLLYDDGHWIIDAELDLLHEIALTDLVPLTGYNQFYVEPEESSGDAEPFFTVAGNEFFVKE